MKMGFANIISLFRILLIPFFVGVLVYYSPEKEYLRYYALGIFLLATLSDVIDGYIARRFHEQTKLGGLLDPLADKLLLLSAFVCLSYFSHLPQELKLPLWVVIVVLSRDVIIVFGSAVVYKMQGMIKVVPSKSGKIATFLQMLTIIYLLLMLPNPQYLLMIMIIFTIISGIGYVVRGTRVVLTNNDEYSKIEGC